MFNWHDKIKEDEIENVSGMGENRNMYSFSLGTLESKEYWGVNGRIILKWIL
jgi:hypothetical protein